MLLRFIIPCVILVYLITLGFFHLHSKDFLSLRREYHLFEHEEVRRHIQKLHHGVDAQTFLKKRFHEIIPPSLPNYKPEQGLEPISPRIIPAGMVRKYLFYHSNKLEQNSVSNTTKIHVSNGNETKVPSIIYFVTPTYHRVTQMADLIRLSYTLDHDFAIYWIVVEDSSTCSKRIRDLLDRTGLPYAHLATLSPLPVPGKLQAKGVMQRNLALDVIEKVGIEGVVYFGDDDNAYDVRMFPELRRTKRVGTFAVGYAGGGTYERCLVHPVTRKVYGFVTKWDADRKFPVDMGGLSFHTSVLFTKQKPRFSLQWELGFLETKFLQLILSSKSELEPLMDDCKAIFVWHVTTKYPYEDKHGTPKSMQTEDSLHPKILPSV